jgi:hypothetical protein
MGILRTLRTHKSTFTNKGRRPFLPASALQRPASRLEADQWRKIARNHGNIDIILIHERPSISLLPSNNPQGKRAQELARAI